MIECERSVPRRDACTFVLSASSFRVIDELSGIALRTSSLCKMRMLDISIAFFKSVMNDLYDEVKAG